MGKTENTTKHLVSGRIQQPPAGGLRRERILAQLATSASPHLLVVVAPPGSGKTTLLSHLVADSTSPAAWLTLDPLTSDTGSVLSHLRATCGRVVPGLQASWPSAEAAVADIEGHLEESVLLVVDDTHVLDTKSTIDVLQVLIRYQPQLLDIAIGARSLPDLDVLTRRLQGSVVHIDADALRFRTWEVEDLFRDCYGIRLGHDEVTALTQRTGGWAAGLQLFHLATQRQPPSSRRAILSGNGKGNRLTRDYLARHILNSLKSDLRDFLVRTSVFDHLTVARCDSLLGISVAVDHLSALERRGLFTSIDDLGEVLEYRYHEVLRSHLLSELSSQLGLAGSREVHSHAAAVLRAEGAYAEAIRAYCLAHDWDMVRELLDVDGAALASKPGTWLDALPASIRERDPWVLLALARRSLADGALDSAANAYRTALAADSELGGGQVAARELRAILAWTEPAYGVVTDWVHVIRAVLKDPRPQILRAEADGLTHRFANAVARLVRGELTLAAASFADILDRSDLTPVTEAAALLGRAVALTLAFEKGAAAARAEASEAAKRLDVPVLLRITTGVQVLAEGPDHAAIDHLISESEDAGDCWGAAALRLGRALSMPPRKHSASDLSAAEDFFRAEEAFALASWAAGVAALSTAMSGADVDRGHYLATERQCRIVGPLPYALTLLASAVGVDDRAEAAAKRLLASKTASRCGASRLVDHLTRLDWRSDGGSASLIPSQRLPQDRAQRPRSAARAGAEPSGHNPDPFPTLQLRCLGQFAVFVDDLPVDVSALRPMHRAVLRLLCLNPNRVVHRDQLVEQLWPGHDPARANHCVQVAISEVRRVLEPDAPRGRWQLLFRESHGYRLALAPGGDSDVETVQRSLRTAEVARLDRSRVDEITALETAIIQYGGDLFPDDNSTEWVASERDRLRLEVSLAHVRLSELRAQEGDFREAARIAERGLRHDRYSDELWRRLIDSLNATKNLAAASAARIAYAEVLGELGVSTS